MVDFMAPLGYTKLKTMDFTIALPLRPVISNNRTVTYMLVKYLAQILKPLGQSHYTSKSRKSFIKILKKQKISPGYQCSFRRGN